MERSNTVILRWIKFVLATAFMTAILVACDDGERGPAGADGNQNINTTTVSFATSLAITIDGVSINSAPVVNFNVSNQDSTALTGLTTSDLRFTIAKLVPGSLGEPSVWQNYINQESSGGMRGSQERDRSGYPLGQLVDKDNGSYTYTFATNLDNAAADCPAPCTDIAGNPLDVSYDPSLTHRVVIQLSHSSADLPPLNEVYTFRPSDGATSGLFSREIVKTETCNECHNELRVHGSRVEAQYCVTCHNPGTWSATDANTADFKVMIHKIHMGEDLPSVKAGGTYVLRDDFSDVVFPQEIRNCTKCHDGSDTDTPDGDNWKTQVTMEACGSCHDTLKFDVAGPPVPGATDPDGHAGGVQNDNSFCAICHSATGPAGSVEASHLLAEPLARQKFKLNILEICGTPVDTDPGPICNPGDRPSVKFSISDPTNGDTEYDLETTPEITGSNVSFLVAWNTDDYNNAGGSGSRPGRADSISFKEGGPGVYVNDTSGGGFKRTVTAPVKAPVDFIIPIGTTGSGAVGAQGRLVGDLDGDGEYNESASCPDPALPPPNGNCLTGEQERIFVKNEVKFFRIDDATVQERRPTVENAKCNQCHDQVSFHGGSRSGEYGVCILCHNPNNTDIAARNNPGAVLPAPDGKDEEAVDFKSMIHGIHAGAQTQYDSSPGHGFREKGLVVYGYGGSTHDYSHVRFPGILQDCQTCHEPGAYLLDDEWASPTANGILSSTITTDTGGDPTWIDPDDDLNISPTAAVCSACHDSDVAKAHMIVPGGAVFDQTQNTITSTIVETCSVCHGPGRDADVEDAHAAR